MLYLYQYPRYWGLPNPSPFCMKVETYLRLAHIPYQVIASRRASRSPKGKLPYIRDDEALVADSSLIVEYLKKKYGDNLDNHLTAMQKAEGIAVQRMLEEHLYWIITYTRWIMPAGWNVLYKEFFSTMPQPLRYLLPPLARRHVRKDLQSQGLGRHDAEEIFMLGKQDLAAVADLLYAQPYLFGEKPTSYDACAYAFLSSILVPPINSSLKSYANLRPELAAYCERIKQLVFPLGASEEKDFYYQGV